MPAPRGGSLPDPPPPGPEVLLGNRGPRTVRLPQPLRHTCVVGVRTEERAVLLTNAAVQLVRQGRDSLVIVLDTGDNLVDPLLRSLGDALPGSTVELDPATNRVAAEDGTYLALPLNPMGRAFHERGEPPIPWTAAGELAADGVWALRETLEDSGAGPLGPYLLQTLAQSLHYVEGASWWDLPFLLSDPAARRRLRERVPQGKPREEVELMLRLWDQEAGEVDLGQVARALHELLASEPLRDAIGQREGIAELSRLRRRRLILLRCPRQVLGEERSRFLGALLLGMIRTAIGRGGWRQDVFLVMDDLDLLRAPATEAMLRDGDAHGVVLLLGAPSLEALVGPLALSMARVPNWVFFPALAPPPGGTRALDFLPPNGLDRELSDLKEGEALRVARERSLDDKAQLEVFRPWPPFPRDAEPAPLRERIRNGIRSFASLDLRSVSPVRTDASEIVALLARFRTRRHGLTDLEEGQKDRDLRLGQMVRYAANASLLRLRSSDGTFELTGAGRSLLATFDAKRPGGAEGPTHGGLLSRFARFLSDEGVEVRIVPQRGGLPLPDGECLRQGVEYSIEVETSPVGRTREQVLRNLAKARERRRRCLFVVQDRRHAESLATFLRERAPETILDRDYAIEHELPEGGFGRFPSGARRGPWLPPWDLPAPGTGSALGTRGSPAAPSNLAAHRPPSDREVLLYVARVLRTRGQLSAGLSDFAEALPAEARGPFVTADGRPRDLKIGQVLGRIGLHSQRRWDAVAKVVVRSYDLTHVPVLAPKDRAPWAVPGGPGEPPRELASADDPGRGGGGGASSASSLVALSASPAPPSSPPTSPASPALAELPPTRGQVLRRVVAELRAQGESQVPPERLLGALGPRERALFPAGDGPPARMSLGRAMAALGVPGQRVFDSKTRTWSMVYLLGSPMT